MSVTSTHYRRKIGTLRTVLAPAGALIALIVLPCASAGAAESAVSPLPESNYAVRSACGAPAPGRASCLALELQPATVSARAHSSPIGVTRKVPLTAGRAAEGAYGLSPKDLQDAYFPGADEQPDAPTREPQTIALVDAYNDYAAEADLKTYDEEFKLPELTKCAAGQQSGCFEQLNQAGSAEEAELPFPHDEAELKERDEACEAEVASAQKNGTGLSAAAEKACVEAEEAGGWAVEISTDIETAHSICQNCKVLLVEAGKPSYGSLKEVEEAPSYRNLGEAEQTAVALGASEVSNSWAGPEPDLDEERELEKDGIDPFDYPDTVITAAAGDSGYLNWTDAEKVEMDKKECLEYARTARERRECEEISYSVGANYPASSPHVVAVGGTKLTIKDGARESESVWNEDPDPESGNDGAGGGGCSERFTAPPWQQGVSDWTEVGCGSDRAVADVAADADPYTGVAVYDSVPDLRAEENEKGEDEILDTPLAWTPIGGTSVASPIIASMFALAGGSNGVEYPAQTLYSHLETTSLNDVTSGGNGQCDDDYVSCNGSLEPTSALYPFDCGEGELICNAAPGCEGKYYNGPTGVGTPDGIGAFRPEKQPAIVPPKCEATDKSSGTNGKEPSIGGNGAGGGGGGSGATQPTTGTSGSPLTTSVPSTTPLSPSTSTSTSTIVPILSAPALTKTATAALSLGKPKASQVAFAFTLNVAARVKVTLAKLLVSHGRKRWQTLPYSLTITAARGRDRARLSGHGQLAPGRYRLTLVPQHGSARSIVFQVG
jgi:hypothetical protein